MRDDSGNRASDNSPAAAADPEEYQDLGFGSTVARDSRQRLLNRDGSFNLVRHGLGFFQSMTIYQYLLTISWRKFYLLALAGYVVMNLVFGLAYFAAGPDALAGSTAVTVSERFLEGLFFSVQTMTTVGYGQLAPGDLAANILVAVEALLGLGGFAVIAALLFARLARPTAHVMFSDHAVIAPYEDGDGLMFRIANGRRSQLLEVEVKVFLARIAISGGKRSREFIALHLERDRISFFPLHWTVVHPIVDGSPLLGLGRREMLANEMEILVQVTGIDETSSQRVYARGSYLAEEIETGSRFTSILDEDTSGMMGVDLSRLDEIVDAPAE